MPWMLPMIMVLSVWPKPSIILWPVCFRNWLNTSGFSASPAMVQCLSVEKSYWERSSRMKKRYMVGGAQNVVMPNCLKSGMMSAALKRSKS